MNLMPHMRVKHLKEIDFNKLFNIGIRFIVFDRDNTLSAHLEKEFYSSEQREVVENCQGIFGKMNVALLSNSEIKVHGS